MGTEIKKKKQTMMCAEYLKFKDKNMKINNDRPTLNNIKIKSLNISETINSISYIALGMYLAYLYIKEDNIIINIGVHALNNILSMIALLLLS